MLFFSKGQLPDLSELAQSFIINFELFLKNYWPEAFKSSKSTDIHTHTLIDKYCLMN